MKPVSRAPAYLIVVALVACGRDEHRTSHAPVDPALDLAIVVPPTMTRVQADLVFVERAAPFGDAASWAADEAAQNDASHDVGAPTPDGDGWVVEMASRLGDFPDVRMWYRPLGGGLAITCTAVLGSRAPTADEHELARKVCFGTQRVAKGLYVPFQFSRTEPSTSVVLALVDEPLNWSVELERVADSPAWRFRPEGVDRRQRVISRGTHADGSWFISGGENYSGNMHYDVAARRTIGALELACHGANYHGEVYSR